MSIIDGKRILIIDDEEDTRKVIKMALESSGYVVEEAKNGIVGLQMVAQNPPDLILLDVMMPKMNGAQVARELKKSESTSLIPVIMITALTDKKYQRAAIWDLKADFFISKPLDFEDLLDKIKQALMRKKFAE